MSSRDDHVRVTKADSPITTCSDSMSGGFGATGAFINRRGDFQAYISAVSINTFSSLSLYFNSFIASLYPFTKHKQASNLRPC